MKFCWSKIYLPNLCLTQDTCFEGSWIWQSKSSAYKVPWKKAIIFSLESVNQKQATHIKTIKKSDYRRDNQTSWLASKRLTSSVTLWLLVPTFWYASGRHCQVYWQRSTSAHYWKTNMTRSWLKIVYRCNYFLLSSIK